MAEPPGTIGRSPVTLTTVRRRDGTFGTAARIRPFNVRKWEVKWLLPEAYWLWRDVGLRGYTRDGLPESSRRERNDQRNVAFADTLWMSACDGAKPGHFSCRNCPLYTATDGSRRAVLARPSRRAVGGSSGYLAPPSSRLMATCSQAGRRVCGERRRKGRYDNVPGLMVALKVNARRHLVYRDEHGHEGTVALDLLDASQRRKVFVERHGELEPAMVWLTQAGMPMAYDSWKMMFQTANRRCAAQGLEDLRCYAHMLRHSCALRWLAAAVFIHDRRLKITDEQREAYQESFGDPYHIVQLILGHRSSQTTRDIYLEPARGLDLEMFLRGTDGAFDLIRRKICWRSSQPALHESRGLPGDAPEEAHREEARPWLSSSIYPER